jgi:anaerobic ribonucleoside-triphosphate reductase activating protein
MAYQPPTSKAKEPSYPVVSHGITMSEIPGHIAVFLELGNCTVKCPGCHSPHLTEPTESSMPLTEILGIVKDQKDKGATAVVLMGGPHNGIDWRDLCKLTWLLSLMLPVGMYVGTSEMDYTTQCLSRWSLLRWLKVGSYNDKRGGLNNRCTNQRFYEKTSNGWEDRTYLFWEDQK